LAAIPLDAARQPPSVWQTPGDLVPRRVLGEVDVAADGSFHLEVPANTAIELQTLDADGMALRSCGWIWAKNHEPRGCIGCHEDGELTPENRFVDAMAQPGVSLTTPSNRNSVVDYCEDILPIVRQKCVSCHGRDGAKPRLDSDGGSMAEDTGNRHVDRAYRNLLMTPDTSAAAEMVGQYVHPGAARKSSLIWHLYGRNTSRPWDGDLAKLPFRPIPAGSAKTLTNKERRAFVEWIDTGALYAEPTSGTNATPRELEGSGLETERS
jgi:hypothetical protein